MSNFQAISKWLAVVRWVVNMIREEVIACMYGENCSYCEKCPTFHHFLEKLYNKQYINVIAC